MALESATTNSHSRRSLDEFHVSDARSASWVARRINETRAYQRRVKEWAERELRRAKRREEFFLARFGGELEDWARRQLAKHPRSKRKCVALPGGVVGFRRAAAKLVITDERRLVAWCKANLPAAVKVVESIAKTPLNEHFASTGEVADGADVIGGGERFYVK